MATRGAPSPASRMRAAAAQSGTESAVKTKRIQGKARPSTTEECCPGPATARRIRIGLWLKPTGRGIMAQKRRRRKPPLPGDSHRHLHRKGGEASRLDAVMAPLPPIWPVAILRYSWGTGEMKMKFRSQLVY
ncbi:hypothetical protein J6590_046712 [Homalodisca vitripennis]|nr:hypothetical protein J6590_046712 [Homalodisca vitripennis]